MQSLAYSALAALPLLGLGDASPLRRRASAGCGQSHDFIGTTGTFSIQSSGGDRSYRIHLPSSYDISTPMALLIAYHGRGDNPTNFEQTTRFSDESINPNMITIYPQGVNNAWEGPTYATEGVSDKVFTSDLIQHIADHYCIDQSRIYGSGHSNGAGFDGTLACSPGHGGDFAAFAPLSGAFYTDVNGNDNCHPARSPIPMLEFHGGSDPTISYEGGDGSGGPLPNIFDWVTRWAGRDSCGSPTETDMGNGVHHYSYSCGGMDGLVQHYKVDGHDHSWFGQDSEIDASPLVISFLSSWSKGTNGTTIMNK